MAYQCEHLIMVEVRVMPCKEDATHSTSTDPHDKAASVLCDKHRDNTVSFMRLNDFVKKYGPLRKYHLT